MGNPMVEPSRRLNQKDGVRLETPSFLVGVHGFKALPAWRRPRRSGRAEPVKVSGVRCQVSGVRCQVSGVRQLRCTILTPEH